MASADWQAEESKSSMLLNLKRQEKQKKTRQNVQFLNQCNLVNYCACSTALILLSHVFNFSSHALLFFCSFGLTHCFAKKEKVS